MTLGQKCVGTWDVGWLIGDYPTLIPVTPQTGEGMGRLLSGTHKVCEFARHGQFSLTCCLSFVSSYHENVPSAKQAKREGLFWFLVPGYSLLWGEVAVT